MFHSIYFGSYYLFDGYHIETSSEKSKTSTIQTSNLLGYANFHDLDFHKLGWRFCINSFLIFENFVEIFLLVSSPFYCATSSHIFLSLSLGSKVEKRIIRMILSVRPEFFYCCRKHFRVRHSTISIKYQFEQFSSYRHFIKQHCTVIPTLKSLIELKL